MFFAINVKLQISGNFSQLFKSRVFHSPPCLQAKFFSVHTEKQRSYVEISAFFPINLRSS